MLKQAINQNIHKFKLMTKSEPFFKSIFGEAWDLMPPVFKNHYANHTHRDDEVIAVGEMSVWQHPLIRPFGFVFQLMQTLVPATGDKMPAQVLFKTQKNDHRFCFDRTLKPMGKEPLRFISFLEAKPNMHVVEWTKSGIGWVCSYAYHEGCIILKHIGYRFKIKSLEVNLPLSFLFGRPSAWEEAIDDTHFRMEMVIKHPLLGQLYSYSGTFEITEVRLAQ